jgi:hypothetical protein
LQTGYKCLRTPRRVRKRTRTRTNGKPRRGRQLGSKNKSTIQKELLASRQMLASDLLAVERMGREITRLEQLAATLYPWDSEGRVIRGKSPNSYKWACELHRDFIALLAPFQSPRLSAVQMLPASANGKRTTVNVTILDEKGRVEWSDVPDGSVDGAVESPVEKPGLKLIEGSLNDPVP